MTFIPENDLEKALLAAVQNPASAPDFYRLLLESDLLVLGMVEGQEDAGEKFSLEPGGKLNLVTGMKGDQRYLPVFSSLKRMQDYVKEESKYLAIPGRGLLDITRGAPVILNPASEYGKELTPEQVAQLLDPRMAVPPRETRTVVGEADYPMELVGALQALFATRPDIQAAWMIQVTFADRAKEPHPLVGIEGGGDWPSLMQAIQAAAEDKVPGTVFDVQRIDRTNRAGLTDSLLQVPPFYQRRDTNPNLN